MTWHLKDRELEKKLVELYPSFLDDLKFGVMHKWNRHCVHVECTRVRDNGDIPNDTVSFWDDELEEVPEYNPKAWNDSRKVKPPRNVLFRANIHRKGFAGEEWVKHRCILHDGYAWKEVDNFKPWGEIINLDFDEWIEFRPWED